MSVVNGYCSLTEFRHHLTPPAQTIHEDSDDDAVIESLIEVASRRVDDLCGRSFYPRIETHKFNTPGAAFSTTPGGYYMPGYGRELWMDDDLLEPITVTNGDTSVILAAHYNLEPANHYPKYAIKLTIGSSEFWKTDNTGNYEQVISINGWWGFHEDYGRAWKAAGTIAVAMADTTTLTISMTAGHVLDARGGEILKIGTEIFNSASVVGNVLTVQQRGDNGSTAATHLILAPVYLWQPMKEVAALTIEVAKVMYHSRYGENIDTTSTYTASGVIVTPRSLPVWAQEVIKETQRIV